MDNGATRLFSYFVCNIEKRIVWRIFAKENYFDLTKNRRKFRQVALKERCTSLNKRSGMFWQNLLKIPLENLNL